MGASSISAHEETQRRGVGVLVGTFVGVLTGVLVAAGFNAWFATGVFVGTGVRVDTRGPLAGGAVAATGLGVRVGKGVFVARAGGGSSGCCGASGTIIWPALVEAVRGAAAGRELAGFEGFSGATGVSLATAGVPMMSFFVAEAAALARASSSFVAVGNGGVGRCFGLSSPPPQAARKSAVAAIRLITVLEGLFRFML